ncbi:hypothetical protein EPO05_04430 [Patescibacteria group bacterium]|nr:MAG: hypothetical protein EPO05_04430 [Patescibacteria group bacterium]
MLTIPKQYASLRFLRPIDWDEIFADWRENEAGQATWKEHWEKRGFASWDEWRKAYVAPIGPEKLEWFLYVIDNPLQDVPLFFGVPSRAWIEGAYDGSQTKQLKDILHLPIVMENEKIPAIRKNFPPTTMLTGLVIGDKIVLGEGMHRAVALASWDPQIPFNSQVTIALASFTGDIPAIGGNRKE